MLATKVWIKLVSACATGKGSGIIGGCCCSVGTSIQFLKLGKFRFLEEVRIEDGFKLSIPSMKPDFVLVMGNIWGRDLVTCIYSKMKWCVSPEFEPSKDALLSPLLDGLCVSTS